MANICQIILNGSDSSKAERGIIELGANKILIVTPNTDRYLAISRKLVNKFDNIADVRVIPIMNTDSFEFSQEFKRLLSENISEFEIKINASTDVRNWKVLAYFSTQQFLPYLRDHSDNRIIFFEIVGGPSITLGEVEYKPPMDEEEMTETDKSTDNVDADKVSYKDVLKNEDLKYFDDSWGNPEKRPLPKIEIYPIDTLTNTEQYIVDIIAGQDVTMEYIKSEYFVMTDKNVTDGLLSRYIGKLKRKAIVIESGRKELEHERNRKLFKLTDYGLKYVLPIIKE